MLSCEMNIKTLKATGTPTVQQDVDKNTTGITYCNSISHVSDTRLIHDGPYAENARCKLDLGCTTTI